MSRADGQAEKGFTIAVLLLQLIMTVAVWFLNTADVQSEKLFALFTAVNLVSFAMVSRPAADRSGPSPRIRS